MAHAGEYHGHAVFIGGGDGFLVAHRPTRLNDGADTGFGGLVDAIAEREEGVRGHHRALHFQPGVTGLDTGNARTVDAAHLPGADTDGHRVLAIDDRIGFHILADAPGEQQVFHFCLVGGAFGNDPGFVIQRKVRLLHQQATVHAFEIQPFSSGSMPNAAGQYPYIFLLRQQRQRSVVNFRRNNNFNKLAIDNGLRGFCIQCPVKGDDTAECGLGIGTVGAVIGLERAASQRNAAGVGVFDDHAGRTFVELLHTFQRGIGVGNVVVR